MEINKNTIFNIVKKCSLKPNKSLGQNFLIDPSVSSRIVDSLNITEDEKILEIGPGLGTLTHFLALRTNPIELVELDKTMVDFLEVVYKDFKNIKIINKDILRVDVSSYDKIVGNLPYYITTDIIVYILLNAAKCRKLVFMIQKEAFPRFSAKVNEDGYGPAAILVSLLGEIRKVVNVGANSFYPNPHIDSIVFEIEFDISKKTKANYDIYRLAKALFANRRKTILNNLSSLVGSKDKALKMLNQLNIKETLRPENLSKQDYANLYLLINSCSGTNKE